METVRKGKGEKEVCVGEGGRYKKRGRGVRLAMWTEGNKRTNNYSSVSFLHFIFPPSPSIFFPLYLTYPSSLDRTARGNSDNSSMLQRSD